ncbi:hypothetical protein WBP07_22160 (plasmid) [Novosphingobium sp. BL-8A]
MQASEVKATGKLFRAHDSHLNADCPIPLGELIRHGTIDTLVEAAMNDERGDVWRYTIVADDGTALTAFQIELVARVFGIRPM